MERKTREFLTGLVKEIEGLSLKIPESIADGSMESALREMASYLSPAGPVKSAGFVVYMPLYQSLKDEADMLANLAGALRLRMEQLGRTEITGIDYFERKLEEFLKKVRAGLGFNPDMPLSLKDWKPKKI